MRTPLLVVAFAILSACGLEQLVSTYGYPGRSLSVAVGQGLNVTLQTVGPGEYASPPTVSSVALRFLGDSLIGPPIPAGPTQQFRFIGQVHGQAIITFHHTGDNPTVVDTVFVH